MMAGMLGAALVTSLWAGVHSGDFPIPRAQEEFRLLGPHVHGYCGTITGDEKAFRHAVVPFGPMDLTVSKGTPDEASVLRSLYLGMVGAICKVDAAVLSRSFHCGPACTSGRREELFSGLRKIKKTVSAFQEMSAVDLVSQWGIVGEDRINNVFVMMGQVVETKPSEVMGFVPSDHWVRLEGLGVYLSRLGISDAAFSSFLRGVKELSLAAVVRDEAGIRVVRVGIGESESGLLFLTKDRRSRTPRSGEKAKDGRRYVTVEELEPGLLFYETD